jgi:plasmid stabilization system protein ParE
MAYRVDFAASAEDDLERLYRWVVVQAPLSGPQWFNKLVRSINSLEHNPRRCPLAPENYQPDNGIRQLLFGRKPNVYRILHCVGEKEKMVYVLHIRHSARSPIPPQELGQPPWH